MPIESLSTAEDMKGEEFSSTELKLTAYEQSSFSDKCKPEASNIGGSPEKNWNFNMSSFIQLEHFLSAFDFH